MTEKYKVIHNEYINDTINGKKRKYSYALLPDFKETNLAFEPSEKGLFFNDVFWFATQYDKLI